MSLLRFSPVLTAALLLGACVSVPSGPSVMVLPGTGKSFDQFRADDMNCLQSISSARNWSKLLPVPGNTITLGPLGTLTQAPSRSAARTGENRRRLMGQPPGAGCGVTRCQPAGHSLTYG